MRNFTVAISKGPLSFDFNPRGFTRCVHVPGNLGDYETQYVTCDEPIRGRYVAVYREERGQIQMCEFEVYQNSGYYYEYEVRGKVMF